MFHKTLTERQLCDGSGATCNARRPRRPRPDIILDLIQHSQYLSICHSQNLQRVKLNCIRSVLQIRKTLLFQHQMKQWKLHRFFNGKFFCSSIQGKEGKRNNRNECRGQKSDYKIAVDSSQSKEKRNYLQLINRKKNIFVYMLKLNLEPQKDLCINQWVIGSP